MVKWNKTSADSRRREDWLNVEKKHLIIKALLVNQRLAKDYREELLKDFKMTRALKAKIRVVNRCVLTGRSGNVVKFFRLSREQILKKLNKGQLSGVRKSSW